MSNAARRTTLPDDTKSCWPSTAVRRNIATAVQHDPTMVLNGVPYVLDRVFHRFCCLSGDRTYSAFRPRSASTRGVHCQSFARGA
jgi:hypothetical protein